MKSIRNLLLVVIMVGAIGIFSGCATSGYLGYAHFVDVYINDNHDCVTLEGNPIEGRVLLFEGDYIIFNNIAKEKVTLKLPEGWFEKTEITIEPGKRKSLKILIKGPKEGSVVSTLYDQQKDGTPKMKVGEEP